MKNNLQTQQRSVTIQVPYDLYENVVLLARSLGLMRMKDGVLQPAISPVVNLCLRFAVSNLSGLTEWLSKEAKN